MRHALLAVGLWVLMFVSTPAAAAEVPAELAAFLDRVFAHLPSVSAGYEAVTWENGDQPTKEGIGLKRFTAVDPDRVIARVMDVDHYQGNLGHVTICRAVPDARFSPPASVRFYQLLSLPVVPNLQHHLVLLDLGTRAGFRVAAWYLLGPETAALTTEDGARSGTSLGLWIADRTGIGYGVSSVPRREDMNVAEWILLTTGADATAKKVIQDNIDAMQKWASGGNPG